MKVQPMKTPMTQVYIYGTSNIQQKTRTALRRYWVKKPSSRSKNNFSPKALLAYGSTRPQPPRRFGEKAVSRAKKGWRETAPPNRSTRGIRCKDSPVWCRESGQTAHINECGTHVGKYMSIDGPSCCASLVAPKKSLSTITRSDFVQLKYSCRIGPYS